MTNMKVYISFLLAASICLLTACGGGGSSHHDSPVDTNNRAIQATCIAGVITDLKNNIGHIFPSASNRLNSTQILRASLSEVATGEELMKLSGITGIKNEGGFIDEYDDSIAKFKERNKNNMSYESDKMAIATNGNRRIGLSIFTLGSANIKTYFATEENSDEIIGVSYIKNQNYTTFAFKNNKALNGLEGRVFKNDVNTFSYQDIVSGFTLAEVYGDDTSFDYQDLAEGTSDVFGYDGNVITKDTTSYLEKYPETIGIRLAVKPLLDNADKIFNTAQSTSGRANIDITDLLKEYNTLEKTKTLIPANNIEDFKSSFSTHELLMDNQSFSDSVITNGLMSLITAKHQDTGLIVGLLMEAADASFNGQKVSPSTLVWFIADPKGKVIVCFAYCDTNDSKSSTTFLYRINVENKNVEGIGFWNDEVQPKGLFENFGFDEKDYQINCRNSTFIGNNPEQFTYTLYNSSDRKTSDGSVTIKYDGTLISSK